MDRKKLRDADNTIVENIIDVLQAFDQEEDNYMSVDDREKLYRLTSLLKHYRNGYHGISKQEEGQMYNEMFELLKHLLPLLII